MPVEVVDEAATAPALADSAAKVGREILACLVRETEELSVLLVDDERMRELNLHWRGKDQPTDVLSFSQVEGEVLLAPHSMLGDVVISVDTLRRQAAEGGWTEEEELARLLLHGVLHLIGFDHEITKDRIVMRREEDRIVRLLRKRGIPCASEGHIS
jgi:probable rRNA maturation factor